MERERQTGRRGVVVYYSGVAATQKGVGYSSDFRGPSLYTGYHHGAISSLLGLVAQVVVWREQGEDNLLELSDVEPTGSGHIARPL